MERNAPVPAGYWDQDDQPRGATIKEVGGDDQAGPVPTLFMTADRVQRGGPNIGPG